MVRAILLIAVLIVIESAQWAAAETLTCTERKAAIRHLGSKFSEAPVAMGMTNTGAVLEVLTSDAGGSWTILITMPDGTACLIAAGEAWRKVPSVAVLGSGARSTAGRKTAPARRRFRPSTAGTAYP